MLRKSQACLLFALVLTVILPTCLSQEQTKSLYLGELLHQLFLINRFINHIDHIHQDLQNNVALTQKPSVKTQLTLSAINSQRDMVINIWENTFRPLVYKQWDCLVIADSQYQAIQQKITSVYFRAAENDLTLIKQPFCNRNHELRWKNKFMEKTCSKLQLQIFQNCKKGIGLQIGVPFLDTEQTKYYPNLQTSKPWLYGNISKQQYLTKVQQLINVYGAVSCPNSFPFLAANKTCIRCLRPTDIYDVSVKACKTMETTTILDGGYFSNNLKANNWVGNIQHLNQDSVCPERNPFFDGKHCISCNLPSYFNASKKECSQCPKDHGFDVPSKTCKSNLFYESNSQNENNYIGIPLTPPLFASLKLCPQDRPFSIGTQCLPCSLPLFFNYLTSKCEACPGGTQFNSSSQSCQGGKGSKINSNLIRSRNFVGRVPIYDRLAGACEEETPFFNSEECVACSLPSYFNFQILKCQMCREKESFDQVLQSCQSRKQSHFTRIRNANLYYNGNFQEIIDIVNEKKKQGLIECSESAPFYDSHIDQCINCPESDPLFDFRGAECIKCPADSSFMESSHICVQRHTEATIQRMIMNSR